MERPGLRNDELDDGGQLKKSRQNDAPTQTAAGFWLACANHF